MKKIISGFEKDIRLSTPVHSVIRREKSVMIKFGVDMSEEKFDAVVLHT